MKLLHALFISNIWLSSGAVALSIFATRTTDIETSIRYPIIIFCFFMMVYNTHGLVNAKARLIFEPKMIHYYKSPIVPWIIISCLLTSTLLLMQSNAAVQQAGVCFIVFGLLYGSKIIPYYTKGKKVWLKPKNIPGLKAFVITAAITSILIGLPILEGDLQYEDYEPMVIVFITLHIFSNTVIGDIRDIKIDKRDRCHTIATFLGMHSTRILLLALNAVFLFLLYRRWDRYHDINTLAMSAPTLITIVSILLINRHFRFKHYHFLDINHFVPIACLLLLEYIY